MSDVTTMTIKIDKELKNDVQRIAKLLGLPLSTLINMYLRQVRDTGKIEFEVPSWAMPEQMTPKMEKIIEEAEEARRKGDVSPTFTDVESAIAWLEAPDED
ncbi:MAG TPA: type II toxin-antitoxin system RelB/DinJ family antitoxin [Acidimicrobiia bacterium]|jgi:addiction module RelB/DinJ family antitoxin|nr:type II toxin-antitoxin system RelB/DinJ family antitoxin [Acidimicrobiia bacterium]